METLSASNNHDSKAASDDKISVSSFIRVIVIRRILVNDMPHDIGDKAKADEYIKDLMTKMKDLNDSMQSATHKTLSHLLNGSISNYLNAWNEQDDIPKTLETIFNKLILTQFIAQYQNITTYKTKDNHNENNNNNNHNNNKYYYQDLVFNMKDLMRIVFAFLDYDDTLQGDLLNCSVVCSHWLYHVYNRPLYAIGAFDKLVEDTAIYDVEKNDGDSGMIRMWQRLGKLKSVGFYFNEKEAAPNQLLLNKLSNLHNIEKLYGRCMTKHLGIFETIVSQSKEKLEQFSFRIKLRPEKENVLSPIILPNVKNLRISCLYFYIIWSNKCEKLELHWAKIIGQKWCDFVIKNCDCSNIKSLSISWENFVKKDFINNKEGEKLLKQLAEQFVNVKDFSIEIYDECEQVLLLFCKYLKSIIEKNNVRIKLSFDDMFNSPDEFDKLIETIKEINIGNKIYKIDFNMDGGSKKMGAMFDRVQQLSKLSMSSLEWMSITHWRSISLDSGIKLIVDEMNELEFESLKVFEYFGFQTDDSTMETVNEILGIPFEKWSKNKLYVIANFSPNYQDDEDESLLFHQFCQKVFDLMIKHEIAINITLQLYKMADESKYQEYYNIYLSYFKEKEILKNYKSPQCCQYCVPLVSPKISSKWDNEQNLGEFVVQSAIKNKSFN